MKQKIMAAIIVLGIILAVLGLIASFAAPWWAFLFPLGLALISSMGYYQSYLDKKKGS